MLVTLKPVGAINEVDKSQEDRETMRLLLRIAIKIGTKVAVATAKDIAKDPDTLRELKIALGIFADLADEGGKFAERLITGEDKPDLVSDCVNYVKSRFFQRQFHLHPQLKKLAHPRYIIASFSVSTFYYKLVYFAHVTSKKQTGCI